jgi:Protein of unknown function (DUF3376)
VAEIVDAWAARKGLMYAKAESETPRGETPTIDRYPGWAKFLLAFDVGYRERRLHFLIEGQNRLYAMLDQPGFEGLDPLVVDRLKRQFYARLDALRQRENATFYSAATRALVAEMFPAAPSAGEVRNIEAFANLFVDRHGAQIERLLDRLAAEIDLIASTRDLDALLGALQPAQWHAGARREVLTGYLGFPYWDVLSFPVMSARKIGELNEILVDRISPQDARALRGFDGPESLKGIGFGHFAAFLSRAYRENDYLLGRLQAADRLIDIVCDSADVDPAQDGIDVAALKKRAFTQILDVEEPHLVHSADLIAALRRSVAEIEKAGPD